MIRITLAELQRLVERAAYAYARERAVSSCPESCAGCAATAAAARDQALVDGLRAIHLGTWADALEKETRTGD